MGQESADMSSFLSSPQGARCVSPQGQFTAGVALIDSVNDNSFKDGDTNITLTGRGFGNAQGEGSLILADNENFDDIVESTEQTITAWSDDTTITFTVVEGSLSAGTVYAYALHDNGFRSESFSVTLEDAYVGIGDIGTVEEVSYGLKCADGNNVLFRFRFTDKTGLTMYFVDGAGSTVDAQSAPEQTSGSDDDWDPVISCPLGATRMKYRLTGPFLVNRDIRVLMSMSGEPLSGDNMNFITSMGGWVDASTGAGVAVWDDPDPGIEFTPNGDVAIARKTVSLDAGAIYLINSVTLSSGLKYKIGTTLGGSEISSGTLHEDTTSAQKFFTAASTTYLEVYDDGAGSNILYLFALLKFVSNKGFWLNSNVTITTPP